MAFGGTGLGETYTFLKEFAKHPTKVGAVAPSSAGLVRAMVDWIDWNSVTNVVEFGPGTGVFTEAIVQRLDDRAKFVAIERSAEMVRIAQRRCPTATIVEESVTNLAAICEAHGIEEIDAVICGLPWASLPVSIQAEIMEVMLARLKRGGQFATFAYWQGVVLPAGRRFSKRLRSSFADVHRSHTVWKNLPPAFVYRCVK